MSEKGVEGQHCLDHAVAGWYPPPPPGDIDTVVHSPLTLSLIPAEAEFLDVIGTKVFRVFLLAIHSHLYQRILLPPPHNPLEQKWFESSL